MPSQFPENNVTGTLTAEKVVTTDTSATSLDVAGGLTIGSGDVALVGVDGKLSGPLSSTIIDDLSGANLTTLNASNLSSGTVATARLGSGTASSSTYLRGDSSWAAIAAGGKVLQVVSATHGTQASTTSSTFVDTGLTAALTPAGTGSKILVFGGVNGCRKDGSTGVGLALGEDIGGAGYSLFQNTFEGLGGYDAGSSTNMIGGVGFGALRSPSTTSAVTYKVQLKSTLNTGTVYTNQSTAVSWIVLMEIGA